MQLLGHISLFVIIIHSNILPLLISVNLRLILHNPGADQIWKMRAYTTDTMVYWSNTHSQTRLQETARQPIIEPKKMGNGMG